MTLTDRTIETNGIKLHVVTSGPEDGPMILFLHGFPEFWYGWKHYLEVLGAQGWFCVAPDQRGYNLSPKPPKTADYATSVIVADALGLIAALGREKAVVICHDWGGVIGWRLALNHAENVHQFVAMNIPHPVVFAKALWTFAQIKKSWYIVMFQLPWFPEWFLSRNDSQRLARVLVESSNPGTFSEADLALYREAWRQPGAVHAMLEWYRAGRNDNSHLRSKTVDCPARLFWGAKDIAFEESLAPASAAMLTDGHLELFADAGHFVQHDAKEAVTEKLLAFLGPAEANQACRPVVR